MKFLISLMKTIANFNIYSEYLINLAIFHHIYFIANYENYYDCYGYNDFNYMHNYYFDCMNDYYYIIEDINYYYNDQ